MDSNENLFDINQIVSIPAIQNEVMLTSSSKEKTEMDSNDMTPQNKIEVMFRSCDEKTYLHTAKVFN